MKETVNALLWVAFIVLVAIFIGIVCLGEILPELTIEKQRTFIYKGLVFRVVLDSALTDSFWTKHIHRVVGSPSNKEGE